MTDLLSVDQILESLNQLSQILQQENDLLVIMKLDDIKNLQDLKLTLINQLVNFDQVIKSNNHLIIQITKDEKIKLVDIYQQVFLLAEENSIRLKQLTKTSNFIVESIRTKVIKEIKQQQNYNSKGDYQNKNNFLISVIKEVI